jgi:hypothetical protein
MAATHPTNTQQQKSESTDPTIKAVNVRMPVPHFVTFKLKDADKTMRQINQFYIQKAVDAIAGKVKSGSRLRNGTLLIETQNNKQAKLLLKANLPVQVERHVSLTFSRSYERQFLGRFVG